MNKFIELISIEIKVFLRDYIALFWTFLFPFFILVVFMSVSPSKETFTNTEVLFVEREHSTTDRAYFASWQAAFEGTALDVTFAPVHPDALEEVFPNNQIRIALSEPDFAVGPVASLVHAQQPSQSAELFMDMLQLMNDRSKVDDEQWLTASHIVLEPTAYEYTSAATQAAQSMTVGLICMTIMSTSLFGFSVILVQLRATNALKMYQVMPMSSALYSSAFMVSRMLIIVAFSIIFMLVADTLYSLEIDYSIGTFANFVVLVSIGAMTFIGIGLLVASRVTSVTAANGIINLVYFPLIFLSGLFFPISTNLEWLNTIASLLPLKEYAEMFNQIIFNENSFVYFQNTLVLMFVWGVVPFMISQRAFVWNAEN